MRVRRIYLKVKYFLELEIYHLRLFLGHLLTFYSRESIEKPHRSARMAQEIEI
jgi:hypothetical protein